MELETDTKRLWASWLALPTLALHAWLAWDGLPGRIPTKTDVTGRAIAWASKGETLTLLLGILGFVLVVTTAAGYLVGYQRPERARSVLILTSLVVAGIWLIENRYLWSLGHG
jgi:uncharacterized membrane protein